MKGGARFAAPTASAARRTVRRPGVAERFASLITSSSSFALAYLFAYLFIVSAHRVRPRGADSIVCRARPKQDSKSTQAFILRCSEACPILALSFATLRWPHGRPDRGT